MATFTKKLSGDSRYSLSFTITEKPISSEDIANNSSRVEYLYKAIKSSGYGYYTSSKTNPVKVTLEGTNVVNKKIAYDFRGVTEITLASGTVTIEHEADGTKTIQCSGYFKDVENDLGSATVSGSLTLTELHKAPEPFVNTIQEANTDLTNYGIANTTFVANLSRKVFTFDSIKYDGATVSQSNYAIKNGDNISTYISLGSIHLLNFTNKPLTIENNKVKLELTAIDSMGAKGTSVVEYDNYILYTKPTLIASNLKSPRDGQLTGKVKLIANGTYYSGNDLVVTPRVYYRYGVKDSNEFSNWIPITPQYEDGLWEINADIGSERGDSETPPANWFNPELMYEIQVYVKDSIDSTSTTYSTNVLLGESIMTKYKDKVDFKKLTIRKEPIITIESYVNYTGSTVADANDTISYNITKAGYTPIGIISINCDGSRASSIRLFRWYIDGTSAKVSYKNAGTNPLIANDTSITIYVAYIRE